VAMAAMVGALAVDGCVDNILR
jgi:hypothetical protein